LFVFCCCIVYHIFITSRCFFFIGYISFWPLIQPSVVTIKKPSQYLTQKNQVSILFYWLPSVHSCHLTISAGLLKISTVSCPTPPAIDIPKRIKPLALSEVFTNFTRIKIDGLKNKQFCLNFDFLCHTRSYSNKMTKRIK